MRLHEDRLIQPAPTSPSDAITAIISLYPVGPDSGSPLAHRWAGNLLELTPDTIERLGGGRVIVNSGSLSDDLDALDPHNWMPGGMNALIRHLKSLDPALRASGTTLLLEPRSRHIIHDAPVARDFFRERPHESVGLALNPTALFEPTMLQFREDHLQRIAEALAPLAAVLILSDASPDEQGEQLVPCDLGGGAFGVESTLKACVPLLTANTPIILRQAGEEPLSSSLVEAIQVWAASRSAV